MRQKWFPELEQNVSVLALGTQAFGTSITLEESFRILDLYRENGGNLLDTARLYGYYAENIQGISEEVLGHWLKARGCRSEILISTKGAHPPLGHMNASRLDRESIESDLNSSLRALQTDVIDIYWLHRDDVNRPVEEILTTLNGFIRAGKVRCIGASNWSLARFREAEQAAEKMSLQGFCASQPQWSLARQETLEDDTLVRFDENAYAYHRANNIPVMPFSSQAKGFYFKLAQGGVESLSRKARERFMSERNMRSFDYLSALSTETGASVGALSMAYLTCQPFPVFPIVGYSSLAQAESMREAGELIMASEHVEALNRISEIMQ